MIYYLFWAFLIVGGLSAAVLIAACVYVLYGDHDYNDYLPHWDSEFNNYKENGR
jgi:hypothetical protein